MGWFGSNKNENDSNDLTLPELPELPPMREAYEQEEIHQLPALPSSQFGEKFSQNRIKEAITRDKEEDSEMSEIPEMKPLPKVPERILDLKEVTKFTKEYPLERKDLPEKEVHIERAKSYRTQPKKQDPVFVRIDKYQESLEVFEKTRTKILEVEELLKKNKSVKEEEEKQIGEWEKQIQEIKDHVQQIDKEMFSKIE